MVTLKELTEYLELIAPSALAESYDNVGLLIGDENAKINKVLISLDTDEQVAKEASELGVQLILSHHPLIFHPVKNILKSSSFGRTAYALIQNNISLYAMHTNFDSVSGGLCDYFLQQICSQKAVASLEGEYPNGIGRIAVLPEHVSLAGLLQRIKQNMNVGQLRFVGDENLAVKRIAVCNGGGADLIYSAAKAEADVFVTGDLKYHHARFAYENGMGLIEIPHYEAEIIFCRYICERLKKHFTDRVDFFVSQKNVNPWNIG